ncbi:ferritin-like fold-containing protein [Microbacterium gorillae]|uniref:ferritin-like fold-containing protein n=1 Tax=Microbacterium gorillae TaxID=1231063 RepID=UPI000590E3A8|nr:ferritin-like fold-containing protein [Microbacterium gorillae]
MVNWFWKRRPTGRQLVLRSRGDMGGALRVDFSELAPDIDTFLGQAAYLQLGYFETLTRLIRATPDLAEKEALSQAAGAALLKHRRLIAIIRDRGEDPIEVMLPFREDLDAFRWKTIGARPRETMLSVHITAGMLDDFYTTLAATYGETGRKVVRVLAADDDREAIANIIRETIASDDEWRWLLSLWGRRLVGDTLLVARAALRPKRLDTNEEKQVEPVFTALMSGHAKRMDALGLAS